MVDKHLVLTRQDGKLIIWKDEQPVAEIPIEQDLCAALLKCGLDLSKPIPVQIVPSGAPQGGVAYSTKSFALDTARVILVSEGEWIVDGDYLAAYTDGSFSGLGVRLIDEKLGGATAFPVLYFNRFNPIKVTNFTKIQLISNAQAGKTLYLFVGRQASAEALTSTSLVATTTQAFSSSRSDKDNHFTTQLVTNAQEVENLTGLLSNRLIITGVSLQADQNLHYVVLFWKQDTFDDTDLDLDAFIGEVDVDLSAYGRRIGGANQYYLDVQHLDIPYVDSDGTNELHISLLNVDATTKNAGATGEVVVEVYYQVAHD